MLKFRHILFKIIGFGKISFDALSEKLYKKSMRNIRVNL